MSAGPDLNFKEQVKQAVQIQEYIGQTITLRRQGSGYVGLCPFHADKRPSFQVNAGRQSWACWVCNLRGDIFDFVMKRESVDFRGALEILADHAGLAMPAFRKAVKKGSAQDKQTLYKASTWAEQQFHQCLLESSDAVIVRNYLRDRGIKDVSIEKFRVGFAPAKFSWLMDRARAAEFAPEILEACGLISQGNHGWYERFRGRVIFPIRDTFERAIAFGGRVVPGVFPEDKEPPAKYINSPETRLFSKSDTLYGLNVVRDEVTRHRKLVIVEGYTDVIAAWQAGLRNVAAVLGTALNERHIRLIKRFADQITLVLDGDSAGQKRANEVLDLFVANDVDLRIMSLPDGSDPFDFLMQVGADSFQQRVDTAPDALEHKIRVETRSVDLINDLQRSHEALDRILATLSAGSASLIDGNAASQLRRERFLTRLSRKFNVDLMKIRQRLNELRQAKRKRKVIRQNVEPEPHAINYDAKECELVSLALGDPTLIDVAIENVAPDQFAEGPLRDIYERMVQLSHTGADLTFESMLLDCEASDIKQCLLLLQEEHELKQDTIRNQTELQIQAKAQMEMVIAAFHDLAAADRDRATIARMQQGGLGDHEEMSQLEELFQQHQIKHQQRSGD